MPQTPTPQGSDTDPVVSRSHLRFPVVGLGASAGGLQALLQFFENVQPGNGMAFVVILHLSPKHESLADNVLQRATYMPVIQVTERVPIQPEHVYVIAPNQQLSMDDGHLGVSALVRTPGHHVAIDIFFRTLAMAHRERAFAVVLSGTGSDGAVGIERIKEQGGVALAQAPADAEHDGMPVAAIGTGMIDFVLPAEELPAKLAELWENARHIQLPPTGDGDAAIGPPPVEEERIDDEAALQNVIAMLCAHTGHDFRNYKRATVLRRIERRLQVKGVATLPEYAQLLDNEPGEFKALLNDMLIGVTNFFRDRDAFEALERDIIPELFRDKLRGEQVRVWVAACATGQEAYSVAMLLADYALQKERPPEIQVFASDIDEHAIATARAGVYPASIVMDVPPSRMRQFFTKEDDRFRIRKTIRDRILFASHNLLRDPPFSKLDMVSCRNLLIYLNRDVQLRVLQMFHSALKPDGFLFLGSSESADAAAEFFVPFDKKNRIYRARPLSRAARYVPVLSHSPVSRVPELAQAGPGARRQFSFAEVHQRALAKFAPPSLVVDRETNIVHMSDAAGRFLRHVGGEPSRNALALILPELRLELRTALYQAQQSGQNVEGARVPVRREDQDFFVSIAVQPFTDGVANMDFMLVMFDETLQAGGSGAATAPAPHKDLVLEQLEAELQRSKEKLQETIEHAEVSNEELRASNEELQAINEELRSATEELETSKEELQSVNEELITVNYELKVKVEETGKANDDLNNLIASTDIATVFVDRAMRIKRFTPRAADIFSIIPTDIGRSLLDITHRLEYDQLAGDVSSTFETLRPVEREVRSSEGRYYIIRLLPYRTTEDKIEGAVMTFFDITRRREAEEQVRTSEMWMRLVAESTDDYAIISTDAEGRVTGWNKGAERTFGWTEEEALGSSLDMIFTPEDLAGGAPENERRRATDEGRAEDERWHMRKDGTRFFCAGVTTPLHNARFRGFAKIARDQTSRAQQEQRREAALWSEQASRTQAETDSAMKDEFLAVMSHELRHPLNLIYINVELLSRLPAVRQSPPALRAASIIRNSVASQAKIIEDLMDMSRVNTGKLALACREVDLADSATRLIEVMQADPVVEGLTLRVLLPDDPLVVSADPVRIEQVMLNLLSNAVKFTPAGGTVTLRLVREEGEARLDVTDTGAGIAAEHLPDVFRMYRQGTAQAVRSKAGLGIGLALVRQLVELHGGRVEAASEGAGKGSRFTVWLPLVNESPASDTADAAGEVGALAGRRVLILDDTEDTAETFQALLELEGAEVHVATTARRALQLLGEQSVDLVISDLSMPDMDGFEFIEAVRAQPKLQGLPAIALSGLARDQDVQRARNAGFSDFMTKPVTLELLNERVARLLSPQ
ncbi:CheR family methyltransferase [Pseudoduganella umbonata]|uniref:PAS domain S-box protein n=1 Tax=Pseudoduganella umbonata TaxID=864828 RepID=A0A4P8HQ36_9BURK|nr:CheR family methyltransferase [Pseudoduganella umbonata]MBB3221529.1 two-component system CheB/CheR fusion protein [Pseudoduganella umbonata]QCP10672.1 PAS domain S-box protein [Pseudoduganella umbonata]